MDVPLLILYHGRTLKTNHFLTNWNKMGTYADITNSYLMHAENMVEKFSKKSIMPEYHFIDILSRLKNP